MQTCFVTTCYSMTAPMGGVIDFYFACNDVLLYDLAITANDWCLVKMEIWTWDAHRPLLGAYHRTRPLIDTERGAWPVMLRAGALRSGYRDCMTITCRAWVKLPPAKDSAHFMHILKNHSASPFQIS